MKIGFISDIHGNFEALKSVLNELDEMGVSEIYCLGDVVGYLTQVNECCNELRRRGVKSIMGNHDWYMASNNYCKRSISVNDYLDYQRSVITTENLEWIRSFKVYRIVENIHMVHGGWENPIDEYLLNPSDEYFKNINGDMFMSGHTHIQMLKKLKNGFYCNPGSVGQPRDTDWRAAYAVFDGVNFVLHRVEYDRPKVLNLLELAGFDDEYYRNLKKRKVEFNN